MYKRIDRDLWCSDGYSYDVFVFVFNDYSIVCFEWFVFNVDFFVYIFNVTNYVQIFNMSDFQNKHDFPAK